MRRALAHGSGRGSGRSPGRTSVAMSSTRSGGPPGTSTAHDAPTLLEVLEPLPQRHRRPRPHVALEMPVAACVEQLGDLLVVPPDHHDPGPRRRDRTPAGLCLQQAGLARELVEPHPPSVPRVGFPRGQPHDRVGEPADPDRRAARARRPRQERPRHRGDVGSSRPRPGVEQGPDGTNRLDQLVTTLGLVEVRDPEDAMLGLVDRISGPDRRGSSDRGSRRRPRPRASRSSRRCEASPG